MRRLIPVAVLACALGLLAACQPGLMGKKPGDVTPNAVTGGAIETTALDPSPAGAGQPEAAKVPEVKAAGPEKAAAQAEAKAEGGAETAKATDAAADSDPAMTEPVPAPTPDVAETPVAPKSEMQLACEKKRGKWARIGKGELHACVYQTKDAGKRCERESQCEGVCLARSGTCSPLKPLFGCNEILQDDGQRVTLCLD